MDNRTDRQLDKGNDMSIEAMKLALDALAQAIRQRGKE